MDFISWGYLGLFLVTFFAATILPFSSEVVVVAFLMAGFNALSVCLIASVGNSIGSIANYEIGRLGNPSWFKKLGIKEAKLNRWQLKVNQYGHWMGLVAWIPFIGDVISLALGYFRAKRYQSYLWMSVGKFLRYGVLVLSFSFFK
jgi:membrane protein YqaA with SNARE-associated domain